jgi:predicted  nucleic acid-binding Zn-ribbon protein
MFLAVVLAATPIPNPPEGMPASTAPWVVVAALITGIAAIGVAFITSNKQAKIARDTAKTQAEVAAAERDAARDREDRARDDQRTREERKERADVHDAVTVAMYELNGQYRLVIKEIDQQAHNHLHVPEHPSYVPFLRALSNIMTRLGEDRLYYTSIEFIGNVMQYGAVRWAPNLLGVLQERLDEWFLGRSSTTETIRLLKEHTVGLQPKDERFVDGPG